MLILVTKTQVRFGSKLIYNRLCRSAANASDVSLNLVIFQYLENILSNDKIE